VPSRRLPLHSGQSFHPAPASHPQGSASRGINEGSSDSPVRSSPRLWPPGWNGQPLGFPPSSAPHRHRRRASRVGTGQRARTSNNAHDISRTSDLARSLNTCDLASHRPLQASRGRGRRRSPAVERSSAPDDTVLDVRVRESDRDLYRPRAGGRGAAAPAPGSGATCRARSSSGCAPSSRRRPQAVTSTSLARSFKIACHRSRRRAKCSSSSPYVVIVTFTRPVSALSSGSLDSTTTSPWP
jgi:hypothetical protein